MKLNLTGSSYPELPRDPIRPMEPTTKQYVDAADLAHASDTVLHLAETQRNLVNAITASAVEINYLVGTSSLIQPQLNARLPLAGGTLTGFLTLHAVPTATNHASTKGYVDTQVATSLARAGGTMTGALTLSGNPTVDFHASTKQYVDTSVSTHAGLLNLHLTTAQNTLLDALTASSTELNHLVGVTSSVQTQLNARLPLSGGTITGNVTLNTGVSVLTTRVPSLDNELVNKAYVDSKAKGVEWKDPVSASNLVNDILSTPPGAPVANDVYIIGPSPTGAWVGRPGQVTYHDGTAWLFITSVAIAPGARFGVRFSSATAVSAGLTARVGKIVTLVSGTPGSYVWEDDIITPGSTTLVFDQQAPDFGVTYSFTDESVWVVTNTSVNISAGDGLALTGNTLSVNTADGIRVSSDVLVLDFDPATGLELTPGGKLGIHINTTDFAFAANEIGLTAANRTAITNSIPRVGTTSVTGVVNFNSGGRLTITTVPSVTTDVTNKQYVDGADTTLQNSINTINSTLSTLNTDPVTLTYVNNQLSTKFDKAGGTITGDVVLQSPMGISVSKVPALAADVTNKLYVDDQNTIHATNFSLHLTSAQNTLLDALTATSTELNYLVGTTSSVQTQLNARVALTGSTMTGLLTLSGTPVNALHAATKTYVDTADGLKLDKVGGVITGHIKFATNPVAADDLSRKGYVDGLDTAARAFTTTEFNKAVLKVGDTLTGFLNLHANPTSNLHASTKQYVDSSVSTLNTSVQGSFTTTNGNVTALTTRVTNLETDDVKLTYVNAQIATRLATAGGSLSGFLTLHADPTADGHAATKRYVDTLSQGLRTKPSVRVTTTANLAATYANGSLGVNATLTATATGALIIDGVTLLVGDRVLVKNQTATLQNGDYFVEQTGNVSLPFILKRNVTADEKDEITGSYFFVYDGSTQKSTSWVLVVANPSTFTLGTDAITVTQFAGVGNVIAGNGLTLTGNTLAVGTASTARIVVSSTNIDLAVTPVSPGTYFSTTVDTYGRVTAGANPTTLAGFGITNGQTLTANGTSLGNVVSSGFLRRDSGGAIKAEPFNVSGVGLSVNHNGTSTTETSITVTSNATSSNVVNTLVSRDASGNFSAGTVVATLTGNASTAAALQTARTFQISGDVVANTVSFNGTAIVNLAAVLSNTGVTAGTYSRVTVDAKGRVTAATNPTTLAGSGITDGATLVYVDTKVAELEDKIAELQAYIMSRI